MSRQPASEGLVCWNKVMRPPGGHEHRSNENWPVCCCLAEYQPRLKQNGKPTPQLRLFLFSYSQRTSGHSMALHWTTSSWTCGRQVAALHHQSATCTRIRTGAGSWPLRTHEVLPELGRTPTEDRGLHNFKCTILDSQ